MERLDRYSGARKPRLDMPAALEFGGGESTSRANDDRKKASR